MKQILNNVYEKNGKLYTKSPDKTKYYGEEQVKGYRSWNPNKSKVAAAIKNGLKELPIDQKTTVLYLGSSTGTTVSHISDIAGKVFAIDLSREMMVSMMKLVENRKNIYPILANAQNTDAYSFIGKVDVIIQDVSCRDQTRILIKNAEKFLKKAGKILFSLKTQSISTDKPSKTMEQQKEIIKKRFKLKQTINLAPYEKNHWMFYAEKC